MKDETKYALDEARRRRSIDEAQGRAPEVMLEWEGRQVRHRINRDGSLSRLGDDGVWLRLGAVAKDAEFPRGEVFYLA